MWNISGVKWKKNWSHKLARQQLASREPSIKPLKHCIYFTTSSLFLKLEKFIKNAIFFIMYKKRVFQVQKKVNFLDGQLKNGEKNIVLWLLMSNKIQHRLTLQTKNCIWLARTDQNWNVKRSKIFQRWPRSNFNKREWIDLGRHWINSLYFASFLSCQANFFVIICSTMIR